MIMNCLNITSCRPFLFKICIVIMHCFYFEWFQRMLLRSKTIIIIIHAIYIFMKHAVQIIFCYPISVYLLFFAVKLYMTPVRLDRSHFLQFPLPFWKTSLYYSFFYLPTLLLTVICPLEKGFCGWGNYVLLG